MAPKPQGNRQAAQEFHLVNRASDLAWVNHEESLVLRDAERELYGTAEELVLELTRGVKEAKKMKNKNKVRR